MNAALAGLAILVIGDSHMIERGYLVDTLHDALLATGAAVDSYGMCGAVAGDWVQPTTNSCGRAERHNADPPVIDRGEGSSAQTIDSLIATHHPDLIVIELGDTMASYGLPELPKAWIQQQVRVLTARIAAQHTACAWVGPPWGSEGLSYPKTFVRVTEMSEFLSTLVPPCRFIDSTPFDRPGEWPTIDGQHLTGDGYRTWGADIAASIVELLRDRPPRTP